MHTAGTDDRTRGAATAPGGRRAPVLLGLVVTCLLVVGVAHPGGATEPAPPRPEPRIVGGTPAASGSWPSVAALVVRGQSATSSQFCGGTVIDRSWVLTAAHCLYDPSEDWNVGASQVDVLVGTVDLGVGGTRIQVAERRLHPSWSPASFRNDIALLRLSTPVPSQIPLQALAGADTDPGGTPTPVGVAGWGSVDGAGEVYPTRLREATMETGPHEACEYFGDGYYVAASMVCAFDEVELDGPCFGDSGGPIAQGSSPNGVQIGISSFLWACGEYPTYFTRVAPFRGWIQSHVRYGPHAGPAELVASAYRDVLGRSTSSTELYAGASALQAGTTPARFVSDLLGLAAFDTRTGGVIRLYRSVFLRAPDSGGLTYWRDLANGGRSMARIAEQMVRAPEFTTLYGPLDDTAFVERVYQNVLGRAPAPDETSFWVGQLASGRRTRGTVMVGFSESAENKAARAAEVQLVGAFGSLIRRVPSTAERSQWLGTSRPTLATFLLGTYAYAARY